MSIVIDISKPQLSKEEVEEYKVLAAKGIRSFALKNYSEAIELLAQSIELAVKKYGDKYDGLGEIYYHYGKALLESSREESDPLGDGVPKDIPVGPDHGSMDYDDESENDGSEEKEELEDENNEAAEEEGTDDDNGEPMEDDETEAAESDNMKNESAEEAAMESNEGTVRDGSKVNDASHQVATSSGENQTEEVEGENIEITDEKEDEEPSDLQLAWEVLELSKLIFESRGDSAKAFLADTLIALGEVSMESESFDSAVEDIKRGLAMQKEIFKSDNRRIPETYYKLGVAYASINKKEEAIDCFNKSIEHLNQRIKILEPSKFPNDESEVKEMKGLVPEILEKIEDLKNEEAKTSSNETNEQDIVPSPEKKATDISHLVKRKRKLSECEESSAKKPTLDC